MSTLELSVPTSLYGVALAEPSVLNRAADGDFIYFTELVRMAFMLTINYTIQGLFLWEISDLADTEDFDCADEHLSLNVICVVVFQVAVFAEIRNSLSLFTLLWHVSSEKMDQEAGAEEGGAVLSKETPSDSGLLDRVQRRVRHPFPEDTKLPQWSLAGVSVLYRSLCAFFIALPKLTIACKLAYAGGRYISGSPDRETLMLNTLAVMFVIEVDEILYEAFTPDHTKDNLATMQTVEVETTNSQRFASWAATTIVYPGVVTCVSMAVVFIPKYNHCDNYEMPR